MEVESVFIDEAEAGQASRQLGSGNCNLANEPGLKATQHRLDVLGNKRGVGAD